MPQIGGEPQISVAHLQAMLAAGLLVPRWWPLRLEIPKVNRQFLQAGENLPVNQTWAGNYVIK